MTPPYGHYYANDPKIYPFYEKAIELDIPIYFHHSHMFGPAREWGMDRLRVVPQYKFLLLRLKDQDADRQADGSYKGRLLRNETRSIPILRLEYTLTPRTRLQAGWQGIGPVSYRVRNHIRDSESYKQRTFFLNLINRSQYFGYDLYTIVGARKSSRKYDDPFRRGDGFDQWSFFVRGLIGFTEYGRPL